MKRLALVLIWCATVALADIRFRHDTLDISFVVPSGWRTLQGPAMADLSPDKDLKGERRPTLTITVRNPPLTFEQFEAEIRQSIKTKGGNRSYHLNGISQKDIASFPARTHHYVVVEKGSRFRFTISLVRLSKFHGFVVTTECMEVDAKAVEPVFAKVIAGLRLGPPRK